ncbi:hypothetical protein [Clostridium saccharoperbutylacetonicum]
MENIHFGDFMSIGSIILGSIAMWQAYLYMKASKKLNDDTAKLMEDGAKRQDQIYSVLRDLKHMWEGGIRLSKDELLIRKTNSFKDSDAYIIIDKINNLFPFAKPMYIESVQAFLNVQDEKEKIITLRKRLDKEEVDKLHEIIHQLYEFGVVLAWNPS